MKQRLKKSQRGEALSMLQRRITRTLFGGLMLLALPALASRAESVNLSSMTCGDFLSLDASASSDVMLWLLGYYTYADDPAEIDRSKKKAQEAQIKQYCGNHRSLPLLDASEIFMDKKYGQND